MKWMVTGWMMEERHFYMRLSRHPLSASAQALWHLLMSKGNSAYWHFPVKVRTYELAGILNLSVTSIKNARRELVKEGYMLYHNGTGRQPASYYMLSLVNEGQLMFNAQRPDSSKALEDETKK
ncbi:MAG: Helix-turn-helix domain-containing protein [Mitsuokella multacida]|jgi:hypothetical protein